MADLDRLFKQIEKEKRKLDIVFANAGAAEYAPFGQVNEAQFDRLFASNVKGTLFSVQKALPLMPDGGAIVLTASVVGSKGFPANNVYAATKAAVRSFARTWTTDLKERKIRVNVVSPSPTDSDGLREAVKGNAAAQQRIQSLAQTGPLGRLARRGDRESCAVPCFG
jgi:NAD(P)-dependent dehydrogenase (short-subunit alcohol dehydrogenase family)